jgi:hypothetical protein
MIKFSRGQAICCDNVTKDDTDYCSIGSWSKKLGKQFVFKLIHQQAFTSN